MTSPFEDDNAEYLALINHENQHSLWPAWRGLPAVSSAVGPKGKRQECPDGVKANWAEMRPKSLIDAMEKARQAR